MLSERIRKLVAHELKLPIDQVGESASAEVLEQWDSIAHINICLAIQGEFGIDMSTDEIGESDSIPALITLVERKQAAET